MDLLRDDFRELPASQAANLIGGEDAAPSGTGWLALPAGAWLVKAVWDFADRWLAT